MEFAQVVIIAMMAEAVWETLKMVWQENKLSVDRVGALCIGLFLAFGVRLNLLEMVGFEVYIPLLGTVLSGILISRGANFVHDLLSAIANLK